jgi:hypothetical protein
MLNQYDPFDEATSGRYLQVILDYVRLILALQELSLELGTTSSPHLGEKE